MQNTTLKQLLLLLSSAVAMLIAASGTMRAQQNCCNPTIDVRNVVAACLPVTVSTSLSGIVTTHTLNANAVYTNLPFLTTSTCPPAPTFDWVSLDGGVTRVTLGTTKTVKANNCCYTVTAAQDSAGCIYLTINGIALSPC